MEFKGQSFPLKSAKENQTRTLFSKVQASQANFLIYTEKFPHKDMLTRVAKAWKNLKLPEDITDLKFKRIKKTIFIYMHFWTVQKAKSC